jgi:hypothetical protein
MGRNIYIYRKDKLAQLASYAIAIETNEFVRFKKVNEENSNLITITNVDRLKMLIERIKIWDNIKKEETIAYEDIQFYNKLGMPMKQNCNYKTRLTAQSILILEDLLEKYYYNKI